LGEGVGHRIGSPPSESSSSILRRKNLNDILVPPVLAHFRDHLARNVKFQVGMNVVGLVQRVKDSKVGHFGKEIAGVLNKLDRREGRRPSPNGVDGQAFELEVAARGIGIHLQED
jgi:hypothetical protein